jgi:molecular chaperone DnaJ
VAQQEWLEKDYYKVLGVSDKATEAEIRRAYRKLAKENHPDHNPGNEERFKEISAAHEVLADAAKRKEYDEIRRLGPMGGMFGGRGAGARGPGAGGSGSFTFSADDLGDMLGGLFGRGRGGANGGPGTRTTTATAGPQRGSDLEAELHLSFQEAVNGVTTTVNVTSEATCHTCHGSGAAPGTTPTTCPDCGGRGVLDDNQGFFSFSRACPRCAGRGVIVETPCPMCKGRGLEVRPRQIKVRVPAGVEDGQRIRRKGGGGAGRNGGPSGDLFVNVKVAAHPLFGRKGKDLTLTVPVTFAEAALGAEISVPTLEDPVKLKVPAGTRSGRTFRVRGRGVDNGKGIGDLLATVEVAVPNKLSPAEREAIEAFAEASQDSPRAHLGV